MDLAAIEVFLTLASELHFGRTAERLKLSQPRVSRMIRSLEGEVGGALFERTSRKVRLTPLGARLRDALWTPYAGLRAAFNDVRDAARDVTGVLRIGTLVTTSGTALTRLVEAFEKRSRRCRIVLSEVETLDPYGALRANEIDVLVSWLAVDESDLVVGPAIDLRPRVLAVAVHHPLAKKSSVSIEDVADYEIVLLEPPLPRALYDAFHPPFAPSGRPIRRTHLARSSVEGVQLVALGRIVHPTVDGPALFRRRDIALVPIRDMSPLPLGLIWCRPMRTSASARSQRLPQALLTVIGTRSKSWPPPSKSSPPFRTI
jgi:DNA-binding transcriptional LysR family regulator